MLFDWKIHTVKARLFLGMGSVILLFIILSLAVVAVLIQTFAHEEVTRDLQVARQAALQYLRIRRNLLEDKGRSLAHAPHLRATLAIEDLDHDTAQYAAEQLAIVAEADLLLLFDRDGRLLADASDAKHFGASFGQDRLISSGLHGEEATGIWTYRENPFLATASPVNVGGGIQGVLVLATKADTTFADEIRTATGRDILILHSGSVAAQSWFGEPQGSLNREDNADLSRMPSHQIAEGESSMFTLAFRDKISLATTVSLDQAKIILSRPLDAFRALYHQTWTWLIIAGFSTGGIALWVTNSISARLSKPIRELVTASEALSEGSLSVAVREDGHDELSTLSLSFNKMARRIERLVGDVQRKAELAEAANVAKSDFLANMSHEIRTPLTAIIGFTSLLIKRNEKSTPEKRLTQLTMIQSSSKHLLNVVNDILDLSKIEANELVVERVRFAPHQAIEEVVSLLKTSATEKGLIFKYEWIRLVPETIDADPVLFKKLLINLLNNAIKFTQTGEVRLTVEIVENGGQSQMMITVTDTGIGIPQDKLELIFAPFTQADASTTRDYGGTGLGLAICRRAARALGGDVSVESKVGEGSTFRAVLDVGSLQNVRFLDHRF